MKHLRSWSLLATLTASTGLLLGANTNWQALVCDPLTSEIYPIDLPIGQPPTAESPFTGVRTPFLVVITPDATRAVVTTFLSPPNDNIFSLNLTTSPISIAASASLTDRGTPLALTPDGTKTYVAEDNGTIQVLKTSDLSNIASIPSTEFEGDSPSFIAISPNGPEGYVTTTTTKVYVFNTDTNHVTGSFSLPTGAQCNQIAVTPNGSEVYVGDLISNQIFYITISDGSVHSITGMSGATFTSGIATAPDGRAAYAVQQGDIGANLTKIDTSTHSTVEFAIPPQLSAPQFVSITPDGKTACIADSGIVGAGQYVAFIDTESGSSSALQLTTSLQSYLIGSAITPDQAPTARFTSMGDGATVAFDGSASSSPIGSIATYAWDFGDGQTSTTSSPTISHTYDTSGTFTVTLTVTNTAGTSTELTFTGQTASNNGGPSAVTTQQISVQATAIASFKGKIHRNHKEKKVYSKTRWSKSLISDTRKYEIFKRNKKVATVKATHKRHKTLRLHPHHFPHKISKDYLHYLDHKYSIRVVNTSGLVSQPTFVHVVKH